jgi:hypothetical protein
LTLGLDLLPPGPGASKRVKVRHQPRKALTGDSVWPMK